MSKNKSKIIAFVILLIMLLSTTIVFADNEQQILTNNDQSLAENNVSEENNISNEESYKKSDVYLAGEDVTVDYIVDGNLFICANTVTINSQIGGDAFIMAKKIVIDSEGYIFSNLFAMAESIEIKGVVYDVYSLSKDLSISKGYVYRDLKSACETLNVNGIIGRNVYAAFSNIFFNNDENSNGVIYGNLNYSSNSEASIPENVVNGEVKYHETSPDSEVISAKSIIIDYVISLIKFIVFVLSIWLLCLWLAPKFLDSTNKYIGKNTLSVFGFGLLALLAIPVLCVILLILQLTSSVSFALLGLYILTLVVSKSLFTITSNNYICSKLKIDKTVGKFGMLVASSTIVWILTNLPYIGGLISFISVTIGLGILIKSIIPIKKNKDIVKNEVVEVSKEN